MKKIQIISALLLLLLLTFVSGGCSTGTSPVSSSEAKEEFTVGFLPLDTRPCCWDMPLELAEISGVKALSPSAEELTFFNDEANTDHVRNWLQENAPSCDALVISMEQLVYGGLLQSRNDNRDTTSRDEALELLRTIKEENPDISIYLSNVLARTATSSFNEEDVIWWRKTNEYSTAYYKAEILKDEEAAAEVAKLEEEIPSDVLDNFLGSRAANHELNLLCIELVEEGIADKLVICIEDCNELGMQTIEQAELVEEIKRLELEDKIAIANGTDEAGSELLMYAVNPDGCSTSVCWLGENVDFTASYEDHKFKDNLNEHCEFMNISLNDTDENVLCILVPKKLQGDYTQNDFSNYEPYTDDELMEMCSEIKDLTDAGKKCYILDLDCAGGGNAAFMSCLGQMMDIKDIYGYSGWNTACNSLGTMLAQLVATNGVNSDLNQNYTAEHILDAVVYQSVVRPAMYKEAESMYEESTGKKVNILNMENPEEKNVWLADEFASQEELIKDIFGDALPNYEVALRWPRLFEISVKCSGFQS